MRRHLPVWFTELIWFGSARMLNAWVPHIVGSFWALVTAVGLIGMVAWFVTESRRKQATLVTDPTSNMMPVWLRWKSRALSRAFMWPTGAVIAALLLTVSLFSFTPTKAKIICLEDHIPQVSRAIEEKEAQYLYDELKVLYPRLEECGLRTPMLEPRQTGHPEYDNTWYGFHNTSLKVLYRKIRNSSFDLEGWNKDFARENAKRERAIASILPQHQ